ncbi:MAG: hypothetical protein NC308_02840 [Clostridium sp.]|nr:transporter [Bacteroides sp.]MCM1197801.1 hypothetical protein [Clostridium sp.]
MGAVIRFVKDWMLLIAMVTGAAAYIIYYNIPSLAPAGPYLHHIVSILQPLLLFFMLFLTFCRIDPRDMRPRKWHIWLLLFQAGLFVALAVLLCILPKFHGGVLIESAMLCLICPTATAAAVVTGKLGGDMSGLTTYTILINLVTAILVPLFVPIVHPVEGITFFTAFSMIMAKVFPLLICPCLLAWIIRYAMPRLHSKITIHGNLAFYIWAVSLTLAIMMTTRSIVHSTIPAVYQFGIAAVSLICCVLQFWAGKKIGRRYGATITAGQSLGQKNTVFAIWMGYTFMTPVTSVAGGFYSIWHNVYNSWQLYRKSHAE